MHAICSSFSKSLFCLFVLGAQVFHGVVVLSLLARVLMNLKYRFVLFDWSLNSVLTMSLSPSAVSPKTMILEAIRSI